MAQCQDVIREAKKLTKEREDLLLELSKRNLSDLEKPSEATSLLLMAQNAVRESTPDTARHLYARAADKLTEEISWYRSLLEGSVG
jgi:hypothetical protein